MKKTLFLLIILCFSSSFSISTFDKSVSRIKSLYQYAVNHKKISLALGSSLIVGLGALKFFHFRKVKKTKEETLKKKFEEEKQLSEIIQSLEPKLIHL